MSSGPAPLPATRGRAPSALILAAGIGRRMQQGPGGPKALLTIGGESLIARHIAILRRAGVDDITVVVGFHAEAMRHALAAAGAPAIAVIENPDYREGSVVSLHTGRSVLCSGNGVVLMDADVIYDDRLMRRLLHSAHADCLLLDRAIEPGDEPVKLCVAGGSIVDFRKQPTIAHEWHGESVGFFLLASATAAELASRVADYVATGRRDMEYEEPIRDMILAASPGRFGFEDITGLPWTEIDFPEDLDKARALLSDLLSSHPSLSQASP